MERDGHGVHAGARASHVRAGALGSRALRLSHRLELLGCYRCHRFQGMLAETSAEPPPIGARKGRKVYASNRPSLVKPLARNIFVTKESVGAPSFDLSDKVAEYEGMEGQTGVPVGPSPETKGLIVGP